MMATHPLLPSAPSHMVEGIARVVSVGDGIAWLEPEQTTSCGHCASSASCGSAQQEAPGMGTVASRLQARRFALDNPPGPLALEVGERVIIGVEDKALIKGSVIAYGLPLVTALVAGGLAQGAYGSDEATMLGMALGLGAGLAVAHLLARLLARRGELTPRFLRRARPGETCSTV